MLNKIDREIFYEPSVSHGNGVINWESPLVSDDASTKSVNLVRRRRRITVFKRTNGRIISRSGSFVEEGKEKKKEEARKKFDGEKSCKLAGPVPITSAVRK